MEVIHITNIENIESIKKYGLIQRKPQLHNFEGYFRNKYDHEKGVIYTFKSSFMDEKFIKDTCYFKVWGTSRNNLLDHYLEKGYKWDDLIEMGTKLFKNLKIKEITFKILKFKITEEDDDIEEFLHIQTYNMNNENTFYTDLDSNMNIIINYWKYLIIK